jgi:hypothetical protein
MRCDDDDDQLITGEAAGYRQHLKQPAPTSGLSTAFLDAAWRDQQAPPPPPSARPAAAGAAAAAAGSAQGLLLHSLCCLPSEPNPAGAPSSVASPPGTPCVRAACPGGHHRQVGAPSTVPGAWPPAARAVPGRPAAGTANDGLQQAAATRAGGRGAACRRPPARPPARRCRRSLKVQEGLAPCFGAPWLPPLCAICPQGPVFSVRLEKPYAMGT